jgi:hypothetical protein
MRTPRIILTLGGLLFAVAPAAAAQGTAIEQDSARADIHAVLRAFYFNLANQNWDALAAYVLSPKLLERRGSPGDLQTVARNRTRGRGRPPAMAAPHTCPSSASPMITEAGIRLMGIGRRCPCRAAAGLHGAWMSSACCTSKSGGASSTQTSSRADRRLKRLSGEGESEAVRCLTTACSRRAPQFYRKRRFVRTPRSRRS